MALGSSGSFSCAVEKCLLLPPQPNLPGVRDKTSLSPPAICTLGTEHPQLSPPMLTLHKQEKEDLLASFCGALCLGQGKWKCCGHSRQFSGDQEGRTDPATPKPSAVRPLAADSSERRKGVSHFPGRRGDQLFSPWLLHASTGKAGGQL